MIRNGLPGFFDIGLSSSGGTLSGSLTLSGAAPQLIGVAGTQGPNRRSNVADAVDTIVMRDEWNAALASPSLQAGQSIGWLDNTATYQEIVRFVARENYTAVRGIVTGTSVPLFIGSSAAGSQDTGILFHPSAPGVYSVRNGVNSILWDPTNHGFTAQVANTGVFVKGNRSAADAGADVVADSVATRTLGNLLSVRNNTVEKAFVDYTGKITAAAGFVATTGNITVSAGSIFVNGSYADDNSKMSMAAAAASWVATAGAYLESRQFASGSDPAAGASGNSRFYARADAAGKMHWCWRAPTGAIQVIAAERPAFTAATLTTPVADFVPTTLSGGTDGAMVAGQSWFAPVFLPESMTLTGIGYNIGSVGGTSKVIVALYAPDGQSANLAHSALGGTTVGTLNTFQEVPFTATYFAPSGWYWVLIQADSTTAKLRFNIACGPRGGTVAGSFGTLPATLTLPTTAGGAGCLIGYTY